MSNVRIERFTASWCGPCRQYTPVLRKLTEERNIPVEDIDVDEYSALAAKYAVTGVPTTMVYVDDELVHRFSGAKPYGALLHELEPWLDES